MSLLADARVGKFDLIVAESLDRLNRDVEETTATSRKSPPSYKRLRFVGVGIHTVGEGPISQCDCTPDYAAGVGA